MNTQTFIDAIKQVVIEESKIGIQSNLEKPPGKKPARELVELSDWYKSLDIKDRSMILKLVRESIEMAVFGFLCVLDGVRAIENTEVKGQLKLYYEKGNKSVLLNDPHEANLHDLI